MANSKIVYFGETLIDLTGDTVTEKNLLAGIKAHGADGEVITGTCDYDANTQDATATAAEILATKVAYNKGSKVTGTMPNKGGVNIVIDGVDDEKNIPQGYHDGSGTVKIKASEQALLIPENIREGVIVLGVTGTMSGSEDVVAQPKSVTPSKEAQTVVPDSGFTHLTQVTVAAIPYEERSNSAGGTTVTIG